MKHILLLLTLVFMLGFSASAKEYDTKNYSYITIDFPDEYTVVTSYTDEASKDWDVFLTGTGKTASEFRKIMRENGRYILAVNARRDWMFEVEKYKKTSAADDFKGASDEELLALAEMSKQGSQSVFNTESSMKVLEGEIVDHEQTQFIKYYWLDRSEQFLTYETVWCGEWYRFYLFPKGNKVTEEQEDEFDKLMQRVKFKEPKYTVKKDGYSVFNEAVYLFPNLERTTETLSAKKVYRMHTMKIVLRWLGVVGIICLVTLVFVFIKMRNRKNKEQDAIRSASVTRHCRSCGEPISESSEICPSCGTRQ